MRLYETKAQLENLKRRCPFKYTMPYKSREIDVYCNVDLDLEERKAYVERGYEKYRNYLREIELRIDGDYVDIWYGTDPLKNFERTRRITGYLVGTLDRFNDAKLAEVNDRVKHEIG